MHWHVNESYRAAHKTGYTTSIEGTAISHLGDNFQGKTESPSGLAMTETKFLCYLPPFTKNLLVLQIVIKYQNYLVISTNH